jgi:hypothetical protein
MTGTAQSRDFTHGWKLPFLIAEAGVELAARAVRWRRRLACTMRRLHHAWTMSRDVEEKGLPALTRDMAQAQGDEVSDGNVVCSSHDVIGERYDHRQTRA